MPPVVIKLKKTALHDVHVNMGAKMVEFAGFHMPLWYTGIRDEHLTVRNSVGIFDVSHMGDLIVEGKDATDFLSFVLPTDFSKKDLMQASYTAFINHRGILIDDTIVTKLSDEKYLVVPNAATADLIYHHLYALAGGYKIKISNFTNELTCLAVQGRNAEKAIQKITDYNLSDLGFFRGAFINIIDLNLNNKPFEENKIFISRTGYTGEDGFELIFPNEYAEKLWWKILNAGKEWGIKPVGLGARDTLRLEKGFLLSGQDFEPLYEPRTPVEAGISWVIDWDHDFLGKEMLHRQKMEKKYDLFRGIVLKERGIPRHGQDIYKNNKKIGYLTSGTLSPVLNVGIGLGYVRRPYIKVGTEVEVEIRGKRVRGEIKKPRILP